MGSVVLPTLRRKREVDSAIRDTLDMVLVLRFGRAADAACLQLDDILAKSSWDISKFATVALVDMDSEEIQVYVDYFDITLVPATIFFFNAHHMKMDSGTPDHTKWIGSFSSKQDFIDVVEGLMSCHSHFHLITQNEESTKVLYDIWDPVDYDAILINLLLKWSKTESCFGPLVNPLKSLQDQYMVSKSVDQTDQHTKV